MNQAKAITTPAARTARGKLQFPSTLMLLATNAIPLFGVLFWHWNALLMLLLYWAETGVIGFWVFTAYLFRPGYDNDDSGRTGWRAYVARLLQVTFLCLFSGLFMAVHLSILRDIFHDRWPPGTDGVTDFIDQMLIATWLWIPLLAMFILHGVKFFFVRIDPETVRLYLPRLASAMRSAEFKGGRTPTQLRDATTAGAVRFFGRIFLMQFALLLGGFLSLKLGNVTPAVLIIAIKSAIELTLQIRVEPVVEG